MANTIRRTVAAVPLWAVALVLAAAFAVAAVVTFGAGSAQAQLERSADLHVTKTVQPRQVTVGERQTFTIKVANEGNRRTVTVKIRVEATQSGRYTNHAFVNHSTDELDHSDNRDDAQARAT